MAIDELQLHHWIILIVSGGILFFIASWIAWLGRFPRFPKGEHFEARYSSDRTVHVIFQTPGIRGARESAWPGPKAVARACAVAVDCIIEEMGAHHAVDDVCIYFVTGARFEAYPYTGLNKAAAFLIDTGASVGSGIPMAVIRERCIEQVVNTGEPVIHEMLHLILGETTKEGVDRGHTGASLEAEWRGNEFASPR
jgi:hypothetical protein